MKLPRWLGGRPDEDIPDDGEAARRAEMIRAEVARVLADVKRSVEAIERKERERGAAGG